MKSSKRRTFEPLNFTPDEPKARSAAAPVGAAKPLTFATERPRPSFGPTPKPKSLREPAPATDALLGVSPGTRRGPPPLGWARHAYLYAAVAAVAWAGMLFAYSIGYVGGVAGLMRAPMQLAVVTLMAILPGVFVFAAAYAVRQGARLAAEARWARTVAEDFVTPAALAAARTGDIAASVRAEVERVSAAALAAHDQLSGVRGALSGETERLGEAAAQAQHTARAVGDALAREREALAGLAGDLREGSQTLLAEVERQSRMVADASDLARSQLQEAEATLASGAERLTGATQDAASAAQAAGSTLAHQAERLDGAAAALSERLRFLDARLGDQRHALGSLLQTLDADQDDVAARLESHRAQMLELVGEARASVGDLGAASASGGQALRELLDGALAQTREIAASVRTERDALRTEAAEARLEAQNELHRSLDALARAGEDARRALGGATEEMQAAAAARIGAARDQVDQLSELAFAAAQSADGAFQTRLSEARRLIEQTAALVEDAGRRAGDRIEAGLGASRGALGDLQGALGDIDAQLARIPAVTQAHADAVRQGVERSLADLTAAARRASEETQGLDAAFQDRIRRNYEMLSEAVRLMGRAAVPPAAPQAPSAATAPADPVAVDPFAAYRRPAEPPSRPEPARPPGVPSASAARSQAFAVRPTAPPTVFGRAGAREGEPAASAGPADLLLEPGVPGLPAAPTSDPAPSSDRTDGQADGLRPRLRFTPTAADEALKAVFTPRPSPGEGERAGTRRDGGRREWDSDLDEWTWKDLLTSMDDPASDTDVLADQMIREIEALGVDAAALLPPARVQEVAAAFLGGDAAAARDTVRRLAPAAIRRLSRRVLTDRGLREQVERYVERYQGLLSDAATAEPLLGTDAGRAYLLLEAAVGDL